jgi:hypothetical protein
MITTRVILAKFEIIKIDGDKAMVVVKSSQTMDSDRVMWLSPGESLEISMPIEWERK